MFKETITYTDYNGQERTEDFYFHLGKNELTTMEFSTAGGFSEMVKRAAATVDMPTLIKIFENMIQKAYGVKSPDGRQFIKNQEVLDAFVQTPAYEELYMKLAMDSDYAAKFVNQLIPNIPEPNAAK